MVGACQDLNTFHCKTLQRAKGEKICLKGCPCSVFRTPVPFLGGKHWWLSCLSGKNGGGPCARLQRKWLIKKSSHHLVQLIIPDCAFFKYIYFFFSWCLNTVSHLFPYISHSSDFCPSISKAQGWYAHYPTCSYDKIMMKIRFHQMSTPNLPRSWISSEASLLSNFNCMRKVKRMWKSFIFPCMFMILPLLKNVCLALAAH